MIYVLSDIHGHKQRFDSIMNQIMGSHLLL